MLLKLGLKKEKISIWDEFIALNRKISSPTGRFLMALYNENPSTYLPMENLCNILKIIDTIVRTKTDISILNRFYIPKEFLQKYNVVANDFALSYQTAETKAVLLEIMVRIRAMMKDSLILPRLIKNFRLRFKICVIVSLTNLMIKKIEDGKLRITITDRIKIFFHGLKFWAFGWK